MSRVFYLTDPVASARYAHAIYSSRRPSSPKAFTSPATSNPYSNFIAEHPHFFVFGTYDYPKTGSCANSTPITPSSPSSSHTADDYMSKELYEVQIAPSVRSK